MATITGFTSSRMLEIENEAIVNGAVNSAGGLILTTRGGEQIDAGNVKGGIGNIGPAGPYGIAGGTTLERNTHFGIPSNEAGQVFLANQSAGWYNIETGWFEIYRATTGLFGLTVPGIVGASGWYPIAAPPWYQPDSQMTMTRVGFLWAANQSWDAGPLSLDVSTGAATQRTVPTPTFCAPGSVSGSIKFTEPGLYDVSWYNQAGGDPGNAGYRITPYGEWPNMHTSWMIFGQAQRSAGSYYWETLVNAIGINVPTAGLEIRLNGFQSIATTNSPKIKIAKRGGGLPNVPA